MEKRAEYIQSIEIKALWKGGRQVKWELQPDVNILSGINGVGKSTIINHAVKALTLMDQRELKPEDQKLAAGVGAKKMLFQDMMDDLLRDTHKTIDRKSNEIQFVQGDETLTPYQLSSGEKQMLSNPYVVHSYAYAIENFQCYAPSLHNVCVMATLNDRNIFNFEEYLKVYSEIVYELFVWMVWLHRVGRFNDFPLSSFNNICTVEQLNIYKPITALEVLRKNVNRKVAYLQSHIPEAKGKLSPLKGERRRLSS